MTNLEIQNSIITNLLLGLEKQSEVYLDLIRDTQYTHEQRKDFDKELSDINNVLTQLSSKTVNYTVSELENLKTLFNDKLIELSNIVSNLELNTLKIEFNSLTPEQKEFLRGEKGDKGENGKSSFELALSYGFLGNEVDFLNSLKGQNGTNGIDGKSAYDIALLNGFVGSQSQWVESLKGQDGVNGVNGIDGTNGIDGKSAYDIALVNGFVGSQSQWVESLKGQDGAVTFESLTSSQIAFLKGENGLDGQNGIDGKSAYDIALVNGFVGSQSQWVESLKGQDGVNGVNGIDGINGIDGKSAYDIALLNGFVGSQSQWVESLKGQDGTNGIDGINGLDGKSAYDIALVNGFVGSQSQWIESLKGEKGADFDIYSLDSNQKELIYNFVVSSPVWSALVKRVDDLENNSNSSSPVISYALNTSNFEIDNCKYRYKKIDINSFIIDIDRNISQLEFYDIISTSLSSLAPTMIESINYKFYFSPKDIKVDSDFNIVPYEGFNWSEIDFIQDSSSTIENYYLASNSLVSTEILNGESIIYDVSAVRNCDYFPVSFICYGGTTALPLSHNLNKSGNLKARILVTLKENHTANLETVTFNGAIKTTNWMAERLHQYLFSDPSLVLPSLQDVFSSIDSVYN